MCQTLRILKKTREALLPCSGGAQGSPEGEKSWGAMTTDLLGSPWPRAQGRLEAQRCGLEGGSWGATGLPPHEGFQSQPQTLSLHFLLCKMSTQGYKTWTEAAINRGDCRPNEGALFHLGRGSEGPSWQQPWMLRGLPILDLHVGAAKEAQNEEPQLLSIFK